MLQNDYMNAANKTRKISGHSYQMSKISGQSVISGQFQDSFEISGISGISKRL